MMVFQALGEAGHQSIIFKKYSFLWAHVHVALVDPNATGFTDPIESGSSPYPQHSKNSVR
jgi:hypothetical protein